MLLNWEKKTEGGCLGVVSCRNSGQRGSRNCFSLGTGQKKKGEAGVCLGGRPLHSVQISVQGTFTKKSQNGVDGER